MWDNGPVKLSPDQFRFQYQLHEGTHDIHATDPERYSMGFMQWSDKTGEVTHIAVLGDKRRQGVATALWNRAQELAAEKGITAPRHSSKRTEAGDAWAKSVGGELPRRTKVSYGPGRLTGVDTPYENYEDL